MEKLLYTYCSTGTRLAQIIKNTTRCFRITLALHVSVEHNIFAALFHVLMSGVDYKKHLVHSQVQRVSGGAGAAGPSARRSATRREATEDAAWAALLQQARRTPPTLSAATRTVIRRCMSHVHFQTNLKRLPLPKPLRDYIMMLEL